MKHYLILFLILKSLSAKPQIVTYAELLCTANEIVVRDSIAFSICPNEVISLDSHLVKQVFAPLYHSAGKTWGDKLNWSLVGKISRLSNYDLLLLLEKNEGKPNQYYNVLHLVSMSKEGKYIASFGLHINRSTDRSSYQTSSMLYTDFTILQQTRIQSGQRSFGGSHLYKLTEKGLFEYLVKN